MSTGSVVLVTGAATGNLTAHALARAGHTVYASMRDVTGRNADHVMAFSDLTREAFVRRLGFAETLELKR